jgi:hypothetical protein
VNLVWAALIVAGVTVVAITAMLLVRPAGPLREATSRTGIARPESSVSSRLGSLCSLDSSSFLPSRASTRRVAAPRPKRRSSPSSSRRLSSCPSLPALRLSGELVCYARSVVYQEWPRMESGSLGEGYYPWGVALPAGGCHSLQPARSGAQWLSPRAAGQTRSLRPPVDRHAG